MLLRFKCKFCSTVSDLSPASPVCPKCGPGVFMATHKDRVACGCCGYTEFKN